MFAVDVESSAENTASIQQSAIVQIQPLRNPTHRAISPLSRSNPVASDLRLKEQLPDLTEAIVYFETIRAKRGL